MVQHDDASTASESHGEDDDLDLPPYPSREPPQSAQPQGRVTEDLGETLSELSDQLDRSRLDEEEDKQATVEEARRGKDRAVDAS